MAERWEPRPEGPKIQPPIDLTELTAEQASRSLDEIIGHIEAGHPTWVTRNPVAESDATSRRVYDFYFKGSLWGFVDHQYPDGYSAFVVEPESGNPVEISRTQSPDEARRAVEARTVQPGPLNR